MATIVVPDFNGWRKNFFEHGHIVRGQNRSIQQIVEKKDATPEQLRIKELNPSILCFQTDWLWKNI